MGPFVPLVSVAATQLVSHAREAHRVKGAPAVPWTTRTDFIHGQPSAAWDTAWFLTFITG